MTHYPKIFALGSVNNQSLLTNRLLIVQEKIDGSQFSFKVNHDLTLSFRSHHCDLIYGQEGMFKIGMEEITLLHEKNPFVIGYTYFGEYLEKPKQNHLKYDRVPKHHVILFDILDQHDEFLPPGDVAMEACGHDLEYVPTYILEYEVPSPDEYLNKKSILGGRVEGYVVKQPYGLVDTRLMGKYVSPEFKEKQRAEWKSEHPGKNDVLENIAASLRTEPRWEKSIQSMRENGTLVGEPKDIGILIPLIQKDILEECEAEIKESLFKWAWPHISRMVVRGVAEYYKGKLVENVSDKQ